MKFDLVTLRKLLDGARLARVYSSSELAQQLIVRDTNLVETISDLSLIHI